MELVTEHFAKNYPTHENAGAFYDKMSGDGYERMMHASGFNEPEYVAKSFGPGQVVDMDPKTTKILDAGAGTGQLGLLLKEKGFTDIVAIDASRSLLDKLDANGAYKESRCMYLGQGTDKFPDDLKERFDIVTSTGCWLAGHIPARGMEDCYAALKVGGLSVNGIRGNFWEKGEKEGYRD